MIDSERKRIEHIHKILANLDTPKLLPKLHSIIFWRWKKNEAKTWSEAFVGEINGEFINVGEYPKTSPMWIDINEIEWRIKQ